MWRGVNPLNWAEGLADGFCLLTELVVVVDWVSRGVTLFRIGLVIQVRLPFTQTQLLKLGLR